MMKWFFILLICLCVSGCAQRRVYTKDGLTSQDFVKDVEECGRQPKAEFNSCMKEKGYIRK